MRVAEEPIDSLDVVLDVSGARPAATELRQRGLATEHQGLDDARQRRRAHGMPDHRPLLEPP